MRENLRANFNSLRLFGCVNYNFQFNKRFTKCCYFNITYTFQHQGKAYTMRVTSWQKNINHKILIELSQKCFGLSVVGKSFTKEKIETIYTPKHNKGFTVKEMLLVSKSHLNVQNPCL